MTMHIFSDLKNRELFLGETEKVENPWANRFVPHFYTEHNINNQIKQYSLCAQWWRFIYSH